MVTTRHHQNPQQPFFTSRWEKRIGSVHGCTKSPIDFASGALVSGGKADEQDFDEALIPFLTGHDANQDMRAAQVSAIREAFEECGILLATDMRTQQMINQERLTELQSYKSH